MDQLLLETKDLPLQQQIDRFHQWLQENPHHVNYSTVQWLLDEKQQLQQQLAEKDQKLAEKDQKLAERDQKLAERDQQLAEKDQKLAENDQKHAQEIAEKDQKLAERDQQLAEKDQKLAENDQKHAQEIAEKDQKLAEMYQKLHASSLKSLKEEFLAISDRTSSGPHLSENHKHAEVQQIDNLVDCLNNLEKNWLDDNFWETSCVPHKQFRECYNESEAQGLVSYILKTLIVALKLSDYIDVVHNATLAGIECDILLVYRPNYLPFAVIEVKKPCNCEEYRLQLWQGKIPKGLKTRQNVVAGQIFDSMSAVRLFGFPNLFGMIATGNQFRLVGTYSGEDPNDRGNFDEKLLNEIRMDTSSDKAIAAVLKEFQGYTSSGCSTTNSPEQPSVVLSRCGSGQTDELANRVVWASEIVPSFEDLNDEDKMIEKVRNSGGEILSLIVLFVVKGCQMLTAFLKSTDGPQLVSPSITIRPKMPCRVLRKNERIFSFGSVQVNSLNLNKYIAKSAQNLYVIHHLGMGEHGNCCLAISSKGESCCAIKFFHKVNRRNDAVMEELENWNKVYRGKEVPDCRVLKAAEGLCLVMPYFRPIPKMERKKVFGNGSIETALKRFASSGFIHCDIKWRHMAFWKDDIILLDLGQIEEEEDEEKRSLWCQEALEKLRNKLPLEEVKNTPRNPGTKRQKSENTPRISGTKRKQRDAGKKSARTR